MALLLQVNDPHLSERAPSSRAPSYCKEVLGKLSWIAKLAVERGVTAVVCTGDWFHSKQASRTPYWLVNTVLDIFRNQPYSVYSIPGNHDYPVGFDSLMLQPYGTLMKSAVITDISERPVTYSDGTVLAGLAYQDSDVLPRIKNLVQKVKPTVLVLHQVIEPPGSSQPYDFIAAEELAGLAKIVLYGHIHDSHGCYSVGGTLFSNPGNISRGSLVEYNLTRVPSVVLIDTVACICEIIAIPHKLAEEVFLLDKAVRLKEVGVDVAAFIDSIEKTQFVALSGEVVLQKLSEIEDVQVRDACISIWNEVG